MIKANLLLIIFLIIVSLIESSTKDDACLEWSKKHIKPTKHEEYFNVSVILIAFNQLKDLEVNCTSRQYKDIARLRLKSLKRNLLPTNFSIINLLTLVDFRYETIVSVRNIKGFLMSQNSNFFEDLVYYLQLYDLNFEFYLTDRQRITPSNCIEENFKDFDFFSSTMNLLLSKGSLYSEKPVCPYVFSNSRLKLITFYEIANSLIFRNRLRFERLNATQTGERITTSITSLSLNIAYISVNEELVNKYVFANLTQLNMIGIILSVQEDLFAHLQKIKMIDIESDNFAVFLHKGLKWLDYLNKGA